MTDGVESRMLRAAMSRTMARTDREMLELAAKAFWGDDIDDCCSVRWLEVDQAIGYTHADNQDHNGEDRERVWNPLDDDGDALRLLAVRKLAVSWEYMPGHVLVEDTESDHHVVEQIIDGDRASALRRAATACMAEIGMAMP